VGFIERVMYHFQTSAIPRSGKIYNPVNRDGAMQGHPLGEINREHVPPTPQIKCSKLERVGELPKLNTIVSGSYSKMSRAFTPGRWSRIPGEARGLSPDSLVRKFDYSNGDTRAFHLERGHPELSKLSYHP